MLHRKVLPAATAGETESRVAGLPRRRARLVGFSGGPRGKTIRMENAGDTDALIRLKVAGAIPVHAAKELGRPLPDTMVQQIRDLCDAVQQELESRDRRFADLAP